MDVVKYNYLIIVLLNFSDNYSFCSLFSVIINFLVPIDYIKAFVNW